MKYTDDTRVQLATYNSQSNKWGNFQWKLKNWKTDWEIE